MSASGILRRWGKNTAHFFMHTRIGKALVFLSLPALIVVVALWETTYEPPIFDVQVHYNKESWPRVSVKAVLGTAKELNIPWMVVGSVPNEGTWKLYEADPKRIIPMLVPYRTREERDTWFNDPRTVQYIEDELNARSYRGIGEFFLFDHQADTAVVQRMVEIARERGLILHARSDEYAIRKLFELGPDLRILWAHGGMFTPPGTIGELIGRYPRLWVDLSLRGDVAHNGNLSPEWREVMLRHPDRFVLGSGTYNTELWYQFRYSFDRFRGWLPELPPGPAERIAFRNGIELFGVKYEEPRKIETRVTQ
jgi:hypothetical protein